MLKRVRASREARSIDRTHERRNAREMEHTLKLARKSEDSCSASTVHPVGDLDAPLATRSLPELLRSVTKLPSRSGVAAACATRSVNHKGVDLTLFQYILLRNDASMHVAHADCCLGTR